MGVAVKTAVVHHRPRREKGSLHRRSQSLATDLPLKPQETTHHNPSCRNSERVLREKKISIQSFTAGFSNSN